MKLTITFPETPDMPPQFPAIAACEMVRIKMQDPANGFGGKFEDGNGSVIAWKIEPDAAEPSQA